MNAESSEMKLWEDPVIITEAAIGALSLYVHAVGDPKFGLGRAMKKYLAILRLLARCDVHVDEASGKKENESEVK